MAGQVRHERLGDRKELLRRLSGHSAFRTEADRQKWITRYKKKQLRGSVISKAVDAVQAVQSTIHRVVGSYQQEADQSQLPQQPELQSEEQINELNEHYEDKVI